MKNTDSMTIRAKCTRYNFVLLAIVCAFTYISARAQSYSQNFDSGTASGWTAVAGTWAVSAGTYDDTSQSTHDMAVYTGATWNADYTYNVSMWGRWGSSGNDFGALFNYVDSTHYHELVLTPVGTAYLRTANGGAPATVATVTGQSLTYQTWYNVSIVRSGTLATVKVGATTLFNNVGLAALGAGKVGVSGLFDLADFDNVSVASNLPSPWAAQDVGTVGAVGSSSYSSGTFTVIGSGADVYGTADAFQYAYQAVSGSYTIIARVATEQNTNAYAKAGVMIRESLNADSKYSFVFLTPSNGILFESRASTGGSSTQTSNLPGYSAPYWLKLERNGSTFTAYRSSDGSTWTSIGSQTLTMNTSVYVGLAVCSHNDGTLNTSTFDNVSVAATDTTAPTVAMTAPSSGSYLKGSAVTVSASASDNVGVAGVQFKLDGSNLGSEDTSSPYSITWDTTTVTDGSHSLTAVARDAANNTTTATAVSVTVDNTAPTVSMTAPTNGGTVSGPSVTVSASASDNIGVSSVQFQLDGSNLGSADTTSPYSITWDSTTVTDGSHTLTAIASDAAGNTTTATSVSVTVSNSGGGTASYAEDFSSGTAAGWVAVAGTWAVSAQTYDDTSQAAKDISIYTGATWNTGYTYELSMWGRWGSSGNDFGAIFNYVDSTHYHEVMLTPVGTAYLKTANGGSPTTVATATGIGTTYQTWYDTSIVRSGTTVTVTIGGTTIFNNVGLADLGAGNIGVSGEFDLADFDDITVTTGTGGGGGSYTTPNSYSENFNGGTAANWSATAGTWSVGTVQNSTAYKNTSSGGTAVYTTNTWSSDYTLRASLQSASSGSSAKVGLLYNYVDANNYYKLLLAADGSAQLLKKVGGGSETSVATASAGSYSGYYDGSGNTPWVEVELVRSGTGTTVRANGARLFNNVAQTDLGAGGIGLTDSGTTANFDNVSVIPTPVVVYSEDLSDGVANNFTVASGTWSVTKGYYQSTSGGTHDYAVYNNATWNTNYTYSVSVASSLTGSSNKLGAIYNYVDANNYYEVLIGGNGTAEIKKVVSGTTTAQGTASYVGAGGVTNRSTNQWIELRILRSGTTTTVNVNGRRVFTNIIQGNLGAGEIGVSAASNNAAKFDNLTVTNGLDVYKATYPKIGGYWIAPAAWYSTTYQQELAQDDYAFISIYRTWHGGGTAADNALQAIKAINPALVITNYADVMEAGNTGSVLESEVYNKLSAEAGPSGGTPTPNDWWARTNTAAHVSQFPEDWMTNISYYVRPDTNGYRFSQWYANWQYNNVLGLSSGYDGAFEDNCYMTAPLVSGPDWNRDGTNDADDSALAMTAYRQGIATYLMKIGQLLPPNGSLLTGNVGGQFAYYTGGLPLTTPEYQYLFNGALYEGMLGISYSDENSYGFSTTLSGYHSLITNTRSPNLVMAQARGTSTGLAYDTSQQSSFGGGANYAFMRYSLAMVLMDNGYIAYHYGDYNIANGFPWFDEFNLYLGEPEEAAQTSAWSNGVYKRKFQNGLALVNPRGNGDQSINVTTLGSYKRFSGTQDSTTNNGANITGAFTLKQGDGLILLKQ